MLLRFTTLDHLVFALFAAALLALGFSARLRDSSILQFLAAGRRLTLPMFVATLVSTWYGGILGVGESVSYFGLGSWVMLGVPYYVFAAVYALRFAERVRGAEQISLPERMETRFGRSMALAGAALVYLLALPAAHVLMLGVLVQAFTGWALLPSILVGAAVGTLFLYKGGLLADARVSLLAFAMMYVGFAVMVAACVSRQAPWVAWAGLEPKTLLAWDGGMGPLYVLSFFLLGVWTLVDPGFHQRVASAESPAVGRKGVLISIACWFAFDMLSMSTGMYAMAWLDPKPELGLQVFPAFGEQMLPPGLKALFVCGMVGTIVSAMVGYTLVSGATLGREVVARLLGCGDDARVKAWTRAGFAVSTLLAVALAVWVESVVSLWYAWAGAVVGALLVPVSLSYGLLWRTKCPGGWMAASSLAAFAVSLAWMVHGFRTGNPSLDVQVLGHRFSLGTVLPGLAVSLVGILLGEAAARRSEHGRTDGASIGRVS
ncbi:MAG: sodium:solute symporter [Fimbriimonadaceae bacterium]